MGPNQQGMFDMDNTGAKSPKTLYPLKSKSSEQKMGTLTLQKVNKLLLNEWEE